MKNANEEKKKNSNETKNSFWNKDNLDYMHNLLKGFKWDDKTIAEKDRILGVKKSNNKSV